jgi:hypothetical protein
LARWGGKAKSDRSNETNPQDFIVLGQDILELADAGNTE